MTTSVDDLCKHYCPEHLEPDTIDHGLASAVILLRLADLVEQCYKVEAGVNHSVFCNSIKLGLGIYDDPHIGDEEYIINNILDEVLYAVAVHNIYPKYLNEYTNFRTDLSKNPFAFFALLCDALQSWDRDKRLWQSENDLPYKTTSDSYDLYIEGDQIRISEKDFGMDVENKAVIFKTGLNSYLKKGSHLLWFELGEWSDKK